MDKTNLYFQWEDCHLFLFHFLQLKDEYWTGLKVYFCIYLYLTVAHRDF